MLIINSQLAISDKELDETFVQASGPGGQNVNKLATAVQLRFDTSRSALPVEVRERLARLAGKRMTAEGVLIIVSKRYRTQEQNREDARERLATLIREAFVAPKHRRATRPTRAARKRRLETKRRRSETKRLRGGGEAY